MASLSLTYLALFGIVLLGIMAMVSNSGETSADRIQQKIYLMNCPDPFYDVEIDFTQVAIEGYQIVWNSSAVTNNSTSGTYFYCYIDELSSGLGLSVSVILKPYPSENTFGIPIGWFGYASDWLGNQFGKAQALGTMVAYFLTPINFEVFGFQLSDLSGLAIMFVIMLYAVSYIFIGLWIYRTLNPLGGST